MKPKVSICIPTYNEPELLRVCLRSIIIQTYKNYEIIITDDSNNDEIKNVINEFNFGNKLKYFKNEKRLGTPENWNEASKHANGDYIKMIHHDDSFFDKNSLSKFVNMLEENPSSNFAFSASQGINTKNKFIYLNTPNKKQLKLLSKNPEFLLLGNFIGSPSATIYKKNNNIKYDINLRWLVDIDFYIKNLFLNKKFIYCKNPLIKILMDGKNQVTREFENNINLQKKEITYLSNKNKKNTILITYYKNLIFCKLQLKNIMKKIILLIKKIIKTLLKIIYSFFIIKDYLSFIKKNKNNRFSIKIKDFYPQIRDKTKKTSFDAHYIYHPAWAARIIEKTKPKKHIDISSTLNFSTMLSAFIPVEFYDYRPADLKLSNLTSDKADLTSLPFEDNSIESLSCMHTVEHIGLGRYGDPLDPDGDLKAIKELSRVLAKDSNLLFVVPIGKPRIQFNAHRIYSYEQIINYFKELKLIEFSLIPDDCLNSGIIYNATKDEADKQEYGCGCFWFKK